MDEEEKYTTFLSLDRVLEVCIDDRVERKEPVEGQEGEKLPAPDVADCSSTVFFLEDLEVVLPWLSVRI